MDCIRTGKSANPLNSPICKQPLQLGKYINEYTFPNAAAPRNLVTVLGIILLPMALIILQKETGSAWCTYPFFFNALQRRDDRNSSILRNLCGSIFYRRPKIQYRNYA